MAEYRMLENDSGHQFLFRGKTVPEHIDSLFISMNDSNYLLITLPELMQFQTIAPRCELDSNSLLRKMGLIGTIKHEEKVLDTTAIYNRNYYCPLNFCGQLKIRAESICRIRP